MKILSLFDGMGCGRLALDRANIPVDKYYASEIDKYAMAVTSHHYPDVIQLGDINNWHNWNIEQPDIIIGGSPCQGFSLAGKQLNFKDHRSKLFFTFVEILQHYKPKYFLLENVKMKAEYRDKISEILGVKPILINSALVSAQNRERYYWTNIAAIEQPKDKGILLKDIIIDATTDRDKSYCIDANYYKGCSYESYKKKSRRQGVWCNQIGVANISGNQSIKRVYSIDGKSPTLTGMQGGNRQPKINVDGKIWRKLTPIECERLQTVPDNWTLVKHPVYKNKMMSNTQRYKMLGNGWTIDVIAHIFNYLLKG